MPDDEPRDSEMIVYADVSEFLRDAQRRVWIHELPPEAPSRYRVALGRERIQLGIIEFRILMFLAARPYHPYSRRHIAEAVGTERYPLVEEAVDEHISTLRDQLGPFFRDYVQSVPYIGFRFKP